MGTKTSQETPSSAGNWKVAVKGRRFESREAFVDKGSTEKY